MTPRPAFAGASPPQTRVSSCTGSTHQSSPDGHLGEMPDTVSAIAECFDELLMHMKPVTTKCSVNDRNFPRFCAQRRPTGAKYISNFDDRLLAYQLTRIMHVF